MYWEPKPLANPKNYGLLENAAIHFLLGKNTITAPIIPMIEKSKDHLKDRSKKAVLPYPNINIIETNIRAIP